MSGFGKKQAATVLMLIFSVLWAMAETIGPKDVDMVIDRLDKELAQRDRYIERRISSIDSLKRIVSAKDASTDVRLSTMLELGDAYNAFNTDSAVAVYSGGMKLAESVGLDSVAMRFELRRLTYLPLLAFIRQAEEGLASIDYDSLPEGLREEYHDAARQMYFYIALCYNSDREVHDSYMEKMHYEQEKLLTRLEEGTPRYMLNRGEHMYYHQDYSRAKALLSMLIERLPVEDNLYARACHILADISKVRGEHHAYVYYLVLSAIADTRGATLEVASLQELGNIMYLNGDIGHAYDYLSTALSGAVECNAPLRVLQSAQVFPIIESAHQAEMAESRFRIYIIMVVMALLLLVLAVSLYAIHRKKDQINRMAVKLEEANRTKDVYISQFLNLCSIYMDKLNQFNKMVNRKITTGKVDDLLKITKQGKFIEEQSKEFYDVFDDAFLHIYPNFVADVNSLLRPDEQVVLKDGEKLNTDLRIMAFMRLGIEESSRIAQMLNYSVYTIYTYRNKLKNRAISRETFDVDVMKIKSVY